MVQVRSLVAVLEVGVLAGCGEQTKRVAATPTPTRTTVTTPEPAGGQQALERLARILSEEPLDRGRICSPAPDLPDPAIAAVDCDYDGDSQGRHLLFQSRADQKAFRARPRRSGKHIRGTACSGRRLPGDIRASSPPAREMCTIWETRG
jgi:hypothetical protein